MLKWYKKHLEKRALEKSLLADRQLSELRFRYHAFKNLLITNNDLLERMTGIETRLQHVRGVIPGLKKTVDKLLKLTLDLVQNLNYLTEGSYTELFPLVRGMGARIQGTVNEIDPDDVIPLILALNEAHTDLISIVGGKAAPLGMLKKTLNLPVPDGFVITTEASQLFFERNDLIPPIRELLREMNSQELRSVDTVSHKIRSLILNAGIPQELQEAIERAYEELKNQAGPGTRFGVAVRSSAIPEDGLYSFAGQFTTVLNVCSREELLNAYKTVVASNFNETSLTYRLHRGMGFQETEMAVLCLVMVPARSAGTLYTTDPNDPQSERMILCSIWGLGEYLVNGRLPSDIFHVSRADPAQFEPVQLARKEMRLICDAERGGTKEVPVAAEDSLRFSIEEAEIHTLCEYGLAIEKYAGTAQDIEWAVSEDGLVHILQARTLHVSGGVHPSSPRELENMKPIMQRGFAASKGYASGKVVRVRNEHEIQKVAPGSILVAPVGFIKIAKVAGFLRGIILERGSPLEHLACVAREYRLPMLVRAANAMEILEEGQAVTIDANASTVYEGEIKSLSLERIPFDTESGRVEPPLNPKVEELKKLLFLLNLVDVRDPTFQLSSCRSVHDVIRFCHERGVQAMFELNDSEHSKNKFYASHLDSPIPFPVEIINLGGGFSVPGHPLKIKIDDITSIPFRAFWNGVSHEGVRWSGPPPRLDMKAFGSVMSNTMLEAARSDRPLGSQTYALISRDYMNLNSRLAYHFAMIDTLCSQETSTNYINFRFKGGGTGLDRRVLRVRFIGRILESLGFFVHTEQDLLNSSLKSVSIGELKEKLDMIGRLLGCSRLLDMAMDNEETMEWFVIEFQRGNYGFQSDPHSETR
jgi:pyruvate,water dikinase